MNVNWVLSDSMSFDTAVDITALKEIGSFWGGWKTWRRCSTDNVICHDPDKAKELMQQAFHAVCNFYVSNETYDALNSPIGVNRYGGTFIHEVDHLDELVALHLSASISDIVLLIGFDLKEKSKKGRKPKKVDKSAELRLHNYQQLVQQVIKDNPDVQWVVIDHPAKLRSGLIELENVNTDTLANVIELLTP